jgi:hypothetical protein
VENVAQRMALNGQKVPHKPGSEDDETASILDKNLLTIPKGHCGVCKPNAEKTQRICSHFKVAKASTVYDLSRKYDS